MIYEVNLTVDRAIRRAFSGWLDGHVREILAIEGFRSAEIFEREPEDGGPRGKVLWTVHYRLRDRRSLRRYLARFAPALRADAVRKFGAGYSATRRVLVAHKSFRVEMPTEKSPPKRVR